MKATAQNQGYPDPQVHEGGRPGLKTESVLRILDSTKSNKSWFNDKGLVAGYHSVSIDGEYFPGQRDSARRLEKLPIDFSGKKVLDIGCSNGGLLHQLSSDIALGVGLDFNARCINAANVLKAANGVSNLHFYCFDLDKEDLTLIRSFLFGQRVDVCFILNISLWVKRWKDVVRMCSGMSDTLVFEAHGTEVQQSAQRQFIESIYRKVQLVSEQSDDDPTYSKRSMYVCHGRIQDSVPSLLSDAAPILTTTDAQSISAAYLATFPAASIDSLVIHPHTHESTVAEVNGEFMLKFPRPNRGVKGIRAEKQITDLVRSRIDVQVPEIQIFADAAVFARYPKIEGRAFDRNAYRKLDDGEKNRLARQLAEFMRAVHSVSVQELTDANVDLAPSWTLKPELMSEQLTSSKHHAICKLLPEVLRNQRDLEGMPRLPSVLGHFDLHGGNLVLDAGHRQLVGVVDFGNCKRGDPHQDFSPICLSSSDLAERVIKAYQDISGLKINPVLVQHYATAFYLNLLAGLAKNNDKDKFDYWLGELEKWYDHLLLDRATARVEEGETQTSLPYSWKRWVASCLMKGSEPVTLLGILRSNGFPDLESAVEIVQAGRHPYIEAGRDVFHVLRKRNWLLSTVNALSSLDSRYAKGIECRETPDFEAFVRDYYSKQLPVVLRKGVDHWPARKLWTPEYFIEHFGNAQVEVQFGREADPLFERNAGKHKKKMKMGDFARMVIEAGSSNDFYMTANNAKGSLAGLEKLFDDVGDFGPGYRDQKLQSASNFLWFGPKGTFTPLHHDLTNNMLIQIHGRKKVTLIPAFQVPLIYNDLGVFSAADFPEFDASKHPLMKQVTPVVVEIGPGDALFIPIGWWHCVESLDVTIGLSFTNFNQMNNFAGDFPR